MDQAKEKDARDVQDLVEGLFVFLCGGVLYYGIEVLWRGYSHPLMAVCGSICFLLLYRLNKHCLSLPFLFRVLMGALIITGVELIAGCILNLYLGLNIWDYSALPYQLWGQICLPYSLLWFLLCIPAAWLCKFIRRVVFFYCE